jgi:hypothetical protein
MQIGLWPGQWARWDTHTHMADAHASPTQDDDEAALRQLRAERDGWRVELKAMLNPCFGSVFRTYTRESFFASLCLRNVDAYTSQVTAARVIAARAYFSSPPQSCLTRSPRPGLRAARARLAWAGTLCVCVPASGHHTCSRLSQ